MRCGYLVLVNSILSFVFLLQDLEVLWFLSSLVTTKQPSEPGLSEALLFGGWTIHDITSILYQFSQTSDEAIFLGFGEANIQIHCLTVLCGSTGFGISIQILLLYLFFVRLSVFLLQFPIRIA